MCSIHGIIPWKENQTKGGFSDLLFIYSFYLLLQGTKKFNELVSGPEILVNRNNS